MEEKFLDFILKHTKKQSIITPKHFYISKKHITISKKKVQNLQADISSLKKERDFLQNERDKLKTEVEFIKNSISDNNKQRLIKEVLELEKNKIALSKKNEKLKDSINKLAFQKGMLENEIINLEETKKGIFVSNKNTSLSIEYIDNLTNGIDFEYCFASILEQLEYSNIQITSPSGDFGIDVLATKDDILYGFQCKLYSNSVGNEAIQQAYSGGTHYNCNVTVVVTNNYFTEQAIEQAKDTKVILWDRKVLINKLNTINKK